MSLSDAELWELHLVVWSLCQWDMKPLDAWLADDGEWPGREHVRQRLHDGREALRHASKQNASDELIELHANNLLLAAQREAMHRAGHAQQLQVIAFGATQRNRRLGKTKLDDADKRRVIRQYDAALVQYGTVQALAHQFNVSEDTIQRVLKKRDSIAAKPG